MSDSDLFDSEEFTEVYERGIRFLSRREYARIELIRRLNDPPVDVDILTEVILRLDAQGYLSDQRYKEMRVRHLTKQGYGLNYITQDLKRFSIQLSQEEANEILAEGEIESEDILESWIRKKASTQIAQVREDRNARNKLKAKLLRGVIRRGYPSDTARSKVDEVLADLLD